MKFLSKLFSKLRVKTPEQGELWENRHHPESVMYIFYADHNKVYYHPDTVRVLHLMDLPVHVFLELYKPHQPKLKASQAF